LFEYIRLRSKGLLINAVAAQILLPSDIAYIHFLHFSVAIRSLHYLAKAWKINPTIMDIMSAKTRAKIFKLVLSLSKMVLTNSNFTKHIIKEVTGINSSVLYPPVIIEHTSDLRLSTRRNWIVIVSRFAKDKRLERILTIARKVRSAKFFIAGLLYDRNYFRELVNMTKTASLDNVIFLPDFPRSKLNYLMLSAKVYLHTMPYEHFGMAVVEGMAHGLVPIVHKSGGPWLDILGCTQGLYGYAYEDEAAEYISRILNHERLRNQMAEMAQKRSFNFSEEQFEQRFSNIIRYIVERQTLATQRRSGLMGSENLGGLFGLLETRTIFRE
jgi:glycosyltransferase involved in cell wall biosynthesis